MIDGYEELRGKISTAFPNIEFSGFVPYEAPLGDDDDDDDGDFNGGAKDEEEEGDNIEISQTIENF